jgi:hypothetical protein
MFIKGKKKEIQRKRENNNEQIKLTVDERIDISKA